MLVHKWFSIANLQMDLRTASNDDIDGMEVLNIGT